VTTSQIYGKIIFNRFYANITAAHTIEFETNDYDPSLSGYTFSNFDASGTPTAQLTIKPTSTSPYVEFFQTTGTVNVSYVSLSTIAAYGGATWNAFTSNGNIDLGGNSGWDFTNPAVNYAVAANQGSYAITGQLANVLRGRLVTADFDSYNVEGGVTSVLIGRKIAADFGAYGINGQIATIVYGGGPGPIIVTDDLLIKLRSFTERRRF
jgi:hypothetical protein